MVWGIIFGSIGLGYSVYGRKQRHLLATLCGLGLIVLPYLLHPLWVLIAVCTVLCAAPIVIRR